jgi:hypothetical protein
MSPHAIPYSRLNAAPAAKPPRRRRRLPSFVTVIALLVVLPLFAANLWFVLAVLTRPDVQITPVRSPAIHVEPLPALTHANHDDLAEARIQGYRAGVAAALERSCQAPALAYPVAGR